MLFMPLCGKLCSWGHLICWRIYSHWVWLLSCKFEVHIVYPSTACGIMICCSGFSLEKELKVFQLFRDIRKIIAQGIKLLPWLLTSTKNTRKWGMKCLSRKGTGGEEYTKSQITHPSSKVKIFRWKKCNFCTR